MNIEKKAKVLTIAVISVMIIIGVAANLTGKAKFTIGLFPLGLVVFLITLLWGALEKQPKNLIILAVMIFGLLILPFVITLLIMLIKEVSNFPVVAFSFIVTGGLIIVLSVLLKNLIILRRTADGYEF